MISTETRMKMSVAKIGNKNMLGKHHSEEAKLKISIGHKGKKQSAEIVKIRQEAILKKYPDGYKHTEEVKEKIGKLHLKEKNPAWKGGRYRIQGYQKIRVYTAKERVGVYKSEHRLVMEKHLGRKLEKTEVVHHINFIRDDNRIENLQVMTRQEHSKLHWTVGKK